MKTSIAACARILPGTLAIVAALAQPTRVHAQYAPPASNRAVYNLNADWRFIRQDVAGAQQVSFNDAAWAMVSAPHTFNDVDSFDDLIPSTGGEPGLYQGIAWYRKRFRLPAAAAGRKVFIEFEGLRQATFVFVNGIAVGQYEHGVTPFGFDITNQVSFGSTDNVIAVKCDTSSGYQEQATGSTYQWNGRHFNPIYGGLTRNIRLYVTDRVHMTLPLFSKLGTVGTYVFPSNIRTGTRTADVNIESQVRNQSTSSRTLSFEAVVVDATGQAVTTIMGPTATLAANATATMRATGGLADVKFWQPGYPYLYTVYSIVREGATVLDVYPIVTGFRKAEFRGGANNGGVYINNKHIFLKGYAQRATNEWAGLGAAVPDWMHDFDGQLIRQSNSDLIRWMHISAEPVDIRMADKYGIVVIQPAGDHEGDSTGRQWEQRVEVMRDSIIYFRNSPSILFWEAGNNWITPDHMREMRDLKARWDPSGMRAIGCRAISDDPAFGGTEAVDAAEYVGTMLNRHYSVYARDRMPIMESEYTRDEAPRRVWDDFSPPDFDYVHAADVTYDWTSEQFATTVAVSSFMEFWGDRIQGPGDHRYSGAAALVWADSNQHGRQLHTENSRVSGRVDAVRIPKESYFTYRVMHSDVPDLHIVGHWTYPAGTRKSVHVVAKGVARVELFVNGVSRGVLSSPTLPDFLYTFPNITWAAGTVRAVGYDSSGAVVAEAQEQTAGAPARLKLTVTTGPTGLRANGADIAMVDVEVVDAQGRRFPTDQDRIDFTVSGPAKFEGGWNSGKADSVHQSFVDTEAGINRVFVRATRAAGTITVSANRSGLESASVSITSRAVSVVDGLSTEMPAGVPPPLPPNVPSYPSDPGDPPTPGTYQLEAGVLAGGAVLENTSGGFNGSGYVNFPATGGSAELRNVDGGAGGNRTLRFRYALGAAVARTGRLLVNGAARDVTFASTGAWNTWATLDITASLGSGTANTVRLESTGQDLANVDQLQILVAPSSVVLPAESAVLGGGTGTETTNGGFNGTGYVNFPATGGFVEFRNVDGGAGASRPLRFRYALGAAGSRTGRLLVNGISQNITFATTGAWTTWATLEVTASLGSGSTNTVRLESTGQDLANLDELQLP